MNNNALPDQLIISSLVSLLHHRLKETDIKIATLKTPSVAIAWSSKCLLLIIYTFSNNWRKIYVETGFSFVWKDDLFFSSGILGLALMDTIGKHLFIYLFGWTVLFRTIKIMWLGNTWTKQKQKKEMKKCMRKQRKQKTENKEKQKDIS